MDMDTITKDRQVPDTIGGIEDFSGRYDYFILDIWGVLHDSIRPFPETVPCLERLRAAGKTICLLSNTPRRSDAIARQLEDMGIARTLYDHILTAGESACIALRDRPDEQHAGLGHDCFLLDECLTVKAERMDGILDGLSLTLRDRPEQASFIMNACGAVLPEKTPLLYERLDAALAHDLPMICMNPDIVVGVGDTEYACAGLFAERYEKRGGTVIYHGKPHRPIYDMAWRLLGMPDKNRMLAIGDALHTDIQGAGAFGIDSLLSLSGIHKKDRAALDGMIAAHTHKPAAILNMFQW